MDCNSTVSIEFTKEFPNAYGTKSSSYNLLRTDNNNYINTKDGK